MLQQTSDGGYILGGHVEQYSDIHCHPWLVKIDADGNKQWEKKYYSIVGNKQGSRININGTFVSVLQTSEGDYILSGWNCGCSNPNGFILKIDETGKEQWNKIFSDYPTEYICSVLPSSDEGYMLTGVGSPNSNEVRSDIMKTLLIKIDESGKEKWCKSFDEMSFVYSSQRTSDGGYVLIGETEGQTPLPYSTSMYSDTMIIKTDKDGNEEWTRVFGGKYYDRPLEIQQTSDNGYIFTGFTQSYSSKGIEQEDIQGSCIWLVKLNNNGDEEWMKIFDKEGEGRSVLQKSDGGYIIAGFKGPYDGEGDGLLIETDDNGNEKTIKKLSEIHYGERIIKASEGGYIVAGDPKSENDAVLLTKTFINKNEPVSIPGFKQILTIFALFCTIILVKRQQKK